MRILILDTIHGGQVIGEELIRHGHDVDMVDVYRGEVGSSPAEVLQKQYDLLIYPVHLNPSFPLLRSISVPSITHHMAVRWIISQMDHGPIIEITGSRGKTTTATALAFLLPGPGVLHTSAGLFRYPEKELLGRLSITPASLMTAMKEIIDTEWLIGEISLGFTGVGDLGILTSGDDYPIASGRKRAFQVKSESAYKVDRLLVPENVIVGHDHEINAGDLVQIDGETMRYAWNGMKGTLNNPLLFLSGYRTALQLAAAAALILGHSPQKLESFLPVTGRMGIIRDDSSVLIDNANSGVCIKSSVDASELGRSLVPEGEFCLIIGQESSSVCENYSTEDIIQSLEQIHPDVIILISGDSHIDPGIIDSWCARSNIGIIHKESVDEAVSFVRCRKYPLIVLSVKTWR